MSAYEEVLSQVQGLSFADKTRLLFALTALVHRPVEVEDDDEETIPSEEIAESEAAWHDYLTGYDQGVSSQELKLKLFAKKID